MISNTEFIDHLLEMREAGPLGELLDDCLSRLIEAQILCSDMHLSLHVAIDCVEDKSRLGGLDILELCVQAGAEGRKPMSIGERDLMFEDCEPFVTPFLPENFID
jgi:hypothetical protein